MLASTHLQHGPTGLRTVEAGLRSWMAEHDYDSVVRLRGSAIHATAGGPSAFERANYM